MLLVDDRIGSRELIKPLQTRGLPAEALRLECADVVMVGRGPAEEPVLVGIEIKALGDLLRVIADGRFAGGQLPCLVHSYDVRHLLVIGEYREGPEGVLQIRRGQKWTEVPWGQRTWKYLEVENWLTTMQVKAGVHIERVRDWATAAAWMAAKYNWWTSGEFEEHRAHLAFDQSGPLVDYHELLAPSLLRRIAKELPGIGWERSKAVSRAFPCLRALVEATVKDWTAIDGIGKVTAERVVAAVNC